jgi:lysophospholipase L1-like esterase
MIAPMHRFRRHARFAIAAAVFALVGAARAETGIATPATAAAVAASERWHDSFEAFAAADKAHAPAPGGVVFVGSSSIRLWSDLETEFDPAQHIVKRGFGGSSMADCAGHVAQLVVPYKPRLVVVYAGDNDLAEGRSPEDVLNSYASFVQSVHRELPDTRIAYLSIKPSPLRESLLPSIRKTNALIADYSRTQPRLDFIDIFSKMLDADGHPRRELFRADALHMNAEGYKLWQTVIAGHLR